MKKSVLFLLSIALVTATAMAQTKTEEKKDLRESIQDKRAHKSAMASNAAHLRLRRSHQQHEKAQAARRLQHRQAKNLRAKGVEHPTRDAKKVIHQQKEAAEKKSGL